LTKYDIICAFCEKDDYETVEKIVDKMTDKEMEYIAMETCDECEHYFEDLERIFRHNKLEEQS